MKKRCFKVPIYDVELTLVQVEKKSDEGHVVSLLKAHDVAQEHIEGVMDNIEKGHMDGGVTFHDLPARVILVVFYPFTSLRWESNIYSHEKRHCEDRILEFFSVEDIESGGLLAGYLGELFDSFRGLE